MPGALKSLGGAVGGVAGGIIGKGGSTNTSNSTTNLNQNVNSTGSSNQTNQGSTQSTGTQSTSPDLPSWYNSFLQGLVPQYNQLFNQASKPLIGQQQQANYMSGLNSQYSGAQQTLLSQLAKSGALDSGRSVQAQTGLQNAKLGQISNYNANVPVQNAMYGNQLLQSLLGQGMGFKAPYGQTTTSDQLTNVLNTLSQIFSSQNNTTSQQTGTSTTKQGGTGLLGMIGM